MSKIGLLQILAVSAVLGLPTIHYLVVSTDFIPALNGQAELP